MSTKNEFHTNKHEIAKRKWESLVPSVEWKSTLHQNAERTKKEKKRKTIICMKHFMYDGVKRARVIIKHFVPFVYLYLCFRVLYRRSFHFIQFYVSCSFV